MKAKLFIDSNFEKKIDQDRICEQAHFSKYHFIRVFHSLYGMTPKNYLIKKRIEKAKDFLANGYSVLDTGFMVGLESPTSFAGMFKKITGMTPSAFQKMEILKQEKILQNPYQFIPNCFAETNGWTS